MENQKTGGIGFLGVLTCVFIALKLMGYIAWNWFWVLSPIFIPSIIVLIIFIILLIIAIVKEMDK